MYWILLAYSGATRRRAAIPIEIGCFISSRFWRTRSLDLQTPIPSLRAYIPPPFCTRTHLLFFICSAKFYMSDWNIPISTIVNSSTAFIRIGDRAGRRGALEHLFQTPRLFRARVRARRAAWSRAARRAGRLPAAARRSPRLVSAGASGPASSAPCLQRALCLCVQWPVLPLGLNPEWFSAPPPTFTNCLIERTFHYNLFS